MLDFEIGDTVYSVDPFIFTIEKINITTQVEIQSEIYYIDEESGCHQEYHLFKNIEDAKRQALLLLEEFKLRKTVEIVNYK